MQILKAAPRTDRPSLRAAGPDPKAMIERAEYLVGRYGAPADKVEGILAGMDRTTQTLLAIEMASRRQSSFSFDHDPFRGL